MSATNLEIQHKGDVVQLAIEIRETRAILKETINGVVQPVRFGFFDFQGSGDNQFMTIRAPIRETDEEGNFLTRARSRDGKFLDASGKEVESEDQAAREYVYKTQKNDETKQVIAQIATLNVKNTKADKTPTAVTLINGKFYTDAEALDAERISFKLNKLDKDSADYQALREELKEKRRTTGTYLNFFINAGADVLREKGFEVRLKDRASA